MRRPVTNLALALAALGWIAAALPAAAAGGKAVTSGDENGSLIVGQALPSLPEAATPAAPRTLSPFWRDALAPRGPQAVTNGGGEQADLILGPIAGG